MNAQEKIDKLLKEIESLRNEQKYCNHIFGEPFYNPADGFEERPTGNVKGQGSHVWMETEFVKVKKPRWTKSCKFCGFEKHTERQRDVSTPKMEPDFD